MTARRPERSRWFRREAARFKEEGRKADAPCWLCRGAKGPIDYDAEPGTPYAHTLDHIHPVSERPDLHDDPANWAHAHHSCNASRGARGVVKECLTLSRLWWRSRRAGNDTMRGTKRGGAS